MSETLPRRFGGYVLTAALGEDALGRVYRAVRFSPEREFVRLRILESPEITEDAVLDAIQENGEIHSFLKNPAIARGVQMDSVAGVPFIAWSEESGRTLDRFGARVRTLPGRIPIEHALLIAEKLATALDHGYNTTIDGERTLHGLVWPGFVSVSDDGETRLSGFGLAPGLLASRGKPRFLREIAPYLAPEERAEGKVGKNSDVYSVGAILFELLTGRLPSPTGPVNDLLALSRGPSPLPPEVTAVLQMCLAEAAARYQSSGELRRELGKLLFSGPYSPSTFNFAYFLNSLFGAEMEAETRARQKEAALDPASVQEVSPPVTPPAGAASKKSPAAPPPSRPVPPVPSFGPREEASRSRAPLAIVGGLLVAAAVAGTLLVISRRQTTASSIAAAPRLAATAIPLPTATAAPSTAAMTEAQFKDEVALRVADELKKIEEEIKRKQAKAQASAPPHPVETELAAARPAESAASAPREAAPAAPAPASTPDAEISAEPVPAAPTAAPTEPPTPAPVNETPPAILTVVKPEYPPLALQARIGGLVVLRVLVSETGRPLEVEVLRPGRAGMTEAAVEAVKRWTFTPGRKGGTPVRSWTTVPIPFEP